MALPDSVMCSVGLPPTALPVLPTEIAWGEPQGPQTPDPKAKLETCRGQVTTSMPVVLVGCWAAGGSV